MILPSQPRPSSFPNILGLIFEMTSIVDKEPSAVLPIHSPILSRTAAGCTAAGCCRRRHSQLLSRRVFFFFRFWAPVRRH